MNRSFVTAALVLTLLGLTACEPRSTTPSVEPETEASTAVTPTPEATPPATQTPTASDYTVIPGQRVGQVTSTTSRQQLADLYGEANLTDEPIHMGEGFTEPGTTVNLGPDQYFSVVWLDAEQSRPLLAKNFGPAWKTPEGIGIGLPYATLQGVLGKFQLYGFAWDYGGTLSLEGSNLDKYYGDLLLRVEPSKAGMDEHRESFEAVMGDRLFPSDDPNLAPLDISVHEMVVYLNDPIE